MTAEAQMAHDLPHLIYSCIREGLALYCSHTNFDRCALEVVDLASDAFELEPSGRLFESPTPEELSGLQRGQGYGFLGAIL